MKLFWSRALGDSCPGQARAEPVQAPPRLGRGIQWAGFELKQLVDAYGM